MRETSGVNAKQKLVVLCCPADGHQITWILICFMGLEEHKVSEVCSSIKQNLKSIFTKQQWHMRHTYAHSRLPSCGWWLQTLIRGHQACQFSPRFFIHHSSFPHTIRRLLVKDDISKKSEVHWECAKDFLSPVCLNSSPLFCHGK